MHLAGTYMAYQIDERIVARIWHGQPVSTEPKNIDVLVPGGYKFIILPKYYVLMHSSCEPTILLITDWKYNIFILQ